MAQIYYLLNGGMHQTYNLMCNIKKIALVYISRRRKEEKDTVAKLKVGGHFVWNKKIIEFVPESDKGVAGSCQSKWGVLWKVSQLSSCRFAALTI